MDVLKKQERLQHLMFNIARQQNAKLIRIYVQLMSQLVVMRFVIGNQLIVQLRFQKNYHQLHLFCHIQQDLPQFQIQELKLLSDGEICLIILI